MDNFELIRKIKLMQIDQEELKRLEKLGRKMESSYIYNRIQQLRTKIKEVKDNIPEYLVDLPEHLWIEAIKVELGEIK